MNNLARIIIVLSVMTAAFPIAEAKRVKTAVKVAKSEETLVSGTFMVASDCQDCNSGYRLDQFVAERYDKPAGSNFESLFITNNSDRTLKRMSFYFTYRNNEGKMLHKRFLQIDCDIPPYETRRVEFKSWDTHRSFYYKGSVKPRKKAEIYDVEIDPVAAYLTFD